ncbi:uncharacterized protein [Musca autumnalis]|uniref:uncharacterized protein n=1 Tax=Musca autumnalis TaxID=221902 RepID=UPI003CF48AEE
MGTFWRNFAIIWLFTQQNLAALPRGPVATHENVCRDANLGGNWAATQTIEVLIALTVSSPHFLSRWNLILKHRLLFGRWSRACLSRFRHTLPAISQALLACGTSHSWTAASVAEQGPLWNWAFNKCVPGSLTVSTCLHLWDHQEEVLDKPHGLDTDDELAVEV